MSSVATFSVTGLRRILGTTAPASLHCSKHRCFILSFPEFYGWAAWPLGTVTSTTLMDQAGRNTLRARRVRRRCQEGQSPCILQWQCNSTKETIKSYPHSGHPLNLLAADVGETLEERKEEWEGTGREAVLPDKNPWFCSCNNGDQLLLLGVQFTPGMILRASALLVSPFSCAGGTYRQHVMKLKFK